uniref:Uncharacterized protein n=1 Tax=Heterorhabditis bacteriophora TaxID=37862 RepID=A0A1I7W951_HETBA
MGDKNEIREDFKFSLLLKIWLVFTMYYLELKLARNFRLCHIIFF